jgi:hypothetical protein
MVRGARMRTTLLQAVRLAGEHLPGVADTGLDLVGNDASTSTPALDLLHPAGQERVRLIAVEHAMVDVSVT